MGRLTFFCTRDVWCHRCGWWYIVKPFRQYSPLEYTEAIITNQMVDSYQLIVIFYHHFKYWTVNFHCNWLGVEYQWMFSCVYRLSQLSSLDWQCFMCFRCHLSRLYLVWALSSTFILWHSSTRPRGYDLPFGCLSACRFICFTDSVTASNVWSNNGLWTKRMWNKYVMNSKCIKEKMREIEREEEKCETRGVKRV